MVFGSERESGEGNSPSPARRSQREHRDSTSSHHSSLTGELITKAQIS